MSLKKWWKILEITSEIKYLLKLSRPRFWMYLAGPALLGIVMASQEVSQLYDLENLFLLLYFLIPANIMLYGVNDFFDRDIDKENPKKDGKEASFNSSKITESLILLSLVSVIPLLAVMPSKAFLAMTGFLALSIGYSAPPLRFKTRPIMDSISNGLYIMPFVIAYSAITLKWPPLTVIIAGWLWAMAMHTYSAIPDIFPDREAGIETTATFFGRKNTYIYCTLVWMLSALAAGFWNVWTGLLLSAYPVICIFFYFSSMNDSKAYWYYPYINAFLGMILTIAGLWVLVHG